MNLRITAGLLGDYTDLENVSLARVGQFPWTRILLIRKKEGEYILRSDFAKGFDLVSHDKLLYTISWTGIDKRVALECFYETDKR